MHYIFDVLRESWHLLLDASIYILFGILVGGLLKVFLNPSFVVRHLGQGRISSVFKAALFGIPIPLCSCGVLPAAVSLKKQGANNGATTAFLISTPESGVDSMAITYALLDPIMTVARPAAAFLSAVSAGVAENLLTPKNEKHWLQSIDLSCPVDNCCDGVDCPPDKHSAHHGFGEKLWYGARYAVSELWGELAGWFFVGLLLAGMIGALVPDGFMGRYMGGGLPSMLIMLVVGVPMYICATASTPVAAALILKGVSPGAALVFLLAGPATNLTSLSVLFGLLGRRATAIYLISLSICALLAGLLVDAVYLGFGISAAAVAGHAAELLPYWLRLAGAVVVLLLSVPPLLQPVRRLMTRIRNGSAPVQGVEEGCRAPS